MNFLIQTTFEQISIRFLHKEDAEMILPLYLSNPFYFSLCKETPTLHSVISDMEALPQKKMNCPSDKYFIGFFIDEKPVAIMDLIDHYPNQDTAFIGLFLVEGTMQRRHVGKRIIDGLSKKLKENGYRKIRLGVIEGNVPAEAFWKNSGFAATAQKYETENYGVKVMEKKL